MATKNLARTMIEGGRHEFNKFERRLETRIMRRVVRNLFNEAVHFHDMTEFWESTAESEPNLQPVEREFNDKLQPFRRWLETQDGKPEQSVLGRLKRRFDPRRLRNWHLAEHASLVWSYAWDPELRHRPFEIGEDGNFRRRPERLPKRRFAPEPGTAEIAAWRNGRLVGKRGCLLFWFNPVPNLFETRYRQSKRLTEDDLVFWKKLSAESQEKLLAEAPTR